jgi:hypothetical protein
MKDTLKSGPKEMGREGIKLAHLSQDSVQWLIMLST